ncbi:hypothetical protein C8J56DRAFT_270497 [Mycena floridula]|nr:hypothetical protein C8J56DRAFT_270497 [Mycena floridula]
MIWWSAWSWRLAFASIEGLAPFGDPELPITLRCRGMEERHRGKTNENDLEMTELTPGTTSPKQPHGKPHPGMLIIAGCPSPSPSSLIFSSFNHPWSTLSITFRMAISMSPFLLAGAPCSMT